MAQNEHEKIQLLKKYYEEHEYPLQKFNLVGIRDESGMSEDVINDRLGFFTDEELFLAGGTTDPGVYWTLSKERNPAGTFHLVTGFHKSIWTFGIHKGYQALVNDYKKCLPTQGWRDANYNYTQDTADIIVCDYFGVNFHRMHESIMMKTIGKYSAGCQVVTNITAFKYIYDEATKSGVDVFNYLLLSKEEFEEIMQ